MAKVITKNDFSIKDYKIIQDFNYIASSLRTKDEPNYHFEDRFIFLYKKLLLNYNRLKKLLEYIQEIYKAKLNEGYDITSLKEIINPDDISFISRCIEEHKEFSKQMNSIHKVNTSYVKVTIKEKADLYIRKIISLYDDKGVLAALEQIIDNDRIPLSSLSSEYFDNLVYYGLVEDTYKLKNNNIFLRDLFSLSKILMCYDIILNKVHQNNTYPTLFGEDKERIVALANKARYINKFKPTEVSKLLIKLGVSQEELNSNMKEYIKHYEQKEIEAKEHKQELELMSLDSEIQKCSEIIMRFINSQFADPDNYLTINRVNKNKFEKALQILMEHNHPTYQEYCKKLQKIAEKIDLDKILDYIKNGVKEDEKVRDFDLVDFYTLSTISTQEAKRIAHKQKSYDDYLIISKFNKKYDNDRKITEANIKIYLNAEISITINGIKYTASDDDKRSAILELQENNIPLTQYTYNIMIKRYIVNKAKPNPNPKLIIKK